jgi:hypothetical protein
MNRVAVFVDAGYVFAQGSVLLAGKKLPRGEIVLDHAAAARAFADFAERISGARLLRIYWYDGTSTGPTTQHLTLAHLDGVKVRLGFVNSVGEQKGVDSLIVRARERPSHSTSTACAARSCTRPTGKSSGSTTRGTS